MHLGIETSHFLTWKIRHHNNIIRITFNFTLNDDRACHLFRASPQNQDRKDRMIILKAVLSMLSNAIMIQFQCKHTTIFQHADGDRKC